MLGCNTVFEVTSSGFPFRLFQFLGISLIGDFFTGRSPSGAKPLELELAVPAL